MDWRLYRVGQLGVQTANMGVAHMRLPYTYGDRTAEPIRLKQAKCAHSNTVIN